MVTNGLAQEFRNCMEWDYMTTPSGRGTAILTDSGFRISEDGREQYGICKDAHNRLRNRRDPDSLEASVFVLSVMYNAVKQDRTYDPFEVRKWAGILGNFEYRLSKHIDNTAGRRLALRKSIHHHMAAKDLDDYSHENASWIGLCYFHLDDHAQALEWLRLSRKRGNRSQENTNLIGKCHFRLEQWQEALEFLQEARLRGDESGENAGHVGRCYFRLGDYENGLKYLMESREKGDESGENSSLIGTCNIELGRYREALGFLLEARERGEIGKELTGKIGECYVKLCDYKEALPYFYESREKGNHSKNNASFTAVCLYRLGKYEKAIEEFSLCLEIAEREGFDDEWMHTLDHQLENFFESASARAWKGNRDLLQSFRSLYSRFMEMWSRNMPGEKNFKLVYQEKDMRVNRMSEIFGQIRFV